MDSTATGEFQQLKTGLLLYANAIIRQISWLNHQLIYCFHYYQLPSKNIHLKIDDHQKYDLIL